MNFLAAKGKRSELDKFVSKTRTLDRLRDESFEETFPELRQLMSGVAKSGEDSRSPAPVPGA
jgi:hypothetical protein